MDYIKAFFGFIFENWPQITSVLAIIGSVVVYLDNRHRRPLEDSKLKGEIELDDAEETNLIGKTYAELLNQLRTENIRLRALEEKFDGMAVELELERVQGLAEIGKRRKLESQVEAILAESVNQSVRIQQVESENVDLKNLIGKLQSKIRVYEAEISKYKAEIETLKNGKNNIL